jgi:hypothetical protein
MLSDIAAHWPPTPSGNEPQTGYKTLTQQVGYSWSETLVGLHEPAWWTGVKLSIPDQDGATFRVSLTNRHGFIADWSQGTGQWHAFPWPIPAQAASIADFRIHITIDDVDGNDSYWLNMRFSFQEMPDMDPHGRYLFVEESGKLKHHWNGGQEQWGSAPDGSDDEDGDTRGDAPAWGREYRVVPPMSRFIEYESAWNNEMSHTPAEWNILAEMD